MEAQQEEAAQTSAAQKPQLTAEEADLMRELTSLCLCLKRVEEQLGVSQSSRHRAILQLAKDDLSRKIESLESRRSDHRTD